MTLEPKILANYQIPYEPLINSTKQEIERSLFSLQQKLRRRKYIDMEMQLQDDISTVKVFSSQANYQENLRNLQEKVKLYRTISKQQIYKQQYISGLEHSNRLQQLKFERDILNRERNVGFPQPYEYLQIYPIKQNSHFQSNDDDELIKKYQNGSKAKQYYNDLTNQQRYINSNKKTVEIEKGIKNANNLQSQSKKINLLEQVQQSNVKKHQIQSTPYNIIKDHQEKNKLKKSSYNTPYEAIKEGLIKNISNEKKILFEELNSSRKQPQLNLNEKKQSKSTVKFQSISKSPYRDADKKINQTSPFRSMSKFNSVGRLLRHHSRSNLSPHKTNNSYDSYLQARGLLKKEPKIKIQYIEASALKKIQNRLKLSQIIYEDSQFKNTKYETNHLFNTFDMEVKQRNEIRDKINSHPYILRKHPLVID